MIALAAILITGISFIFAAHEDGEATNGGCDVLYWQSDEERLFINSTDPRAPDQIFALDVDVPCDGTQMAHFFASVDADANTYVQTYVRATCTGGDCLEAAAPPFARTQICAPGNMRMPADITQPATNEIGVVFASGGNDPNDGDDRQTNSMFAFCGATPPGAGQIAAGAYRFEVLAFKSGAGQAYLDERGVSIETWGSVNCFDNRGRDRDADCDRERNRRRDGR